MITHDLGVAADIAQQASVMKDGRIVERGPIAEVFRHPQHDYTKLLLNARGKGVPAVRSSSSETLLDIAALCVDYGAVRAVDAVSMNLTRARSSASSAKAALANRPWPVRS